MICSTLISMDAVPFSETNTTRHDTTKYSTWICLTYKEPIRALSTLLIHILDSVYVLLLSHTSFSRWFYTARSRTGIQLGFYCRFMLLVSLYVFIFFYVPCNVVLIIRYMQQILFSLAMNNAPNVSVVIGFVTNFITLWSSSSGALGLRTVYPRRIYWTNVTHLKWYRDHMLNIQ